MQTYEVLLLLLVALLGAVAYQQYWTNSYLEAIIFHQFLNNEEELTDEE